MKLQFIKNHALGNDFILIDNRSSKLKKINQLAKTLCDRRFGIGADQLLLLNHSKTADFKMRIFNADGSEVEMCGNGIRCLAKYIWDNKIRSQPAPLRGARSGKSVEATLRGDPLREFRGQKLSIETLAGIIHLKKSASLIKVDMGEPILEPERIPVRLKVKEYPKLKSSIVNHPLKLKNKTYRVTCVSMGNPHAVIVVKNVLTVPLSTIGPVIENNGFFPKKTNVEFIQILNRKNIKMRVWERGSGETMACGTGASASTIASFLLGLTDRKVTVHLQGGKLLIDWSQKNNHVYMTGPAVKVFEGTVDL